MSRMTEELDAMRLNGAPADKWVAANDAVDEAALAIEIADGLVLGTTQRHAMLVATLRAMSRAGPPVSPERTLNDTTRNVISKTGPSGIQP